jgi:GH15 family glucan-1,4-alpha-glucosidase
MRIDGYAPIEDYAAIGDGRTVALVARDGAIDWLCFPDHDSPSVFGALLDPERGGRFALAPIAPYEVERRYVPDTNVLETTFATANGTVKVTDAMTLQDGGLPPWLELARRIEGLAGAVTLRWSVEPRFGYGKRETTIEIRNGVPVARADADALAISSWDAGAPRVERGAVTSEFTLREGESALLALSGAHASPVHLTPRDGVARRLGGTVDAWRRWLHGRPEYDGPWLDEIRRSLLAVKLLIHAPSGAITAAPTTSLPEHIGGPENYDYRFAWVRDSSFTLDVLMRMQHHEQAHASFTWLLEALVDTHPRVQPIYRIHGDVLAGEEQLALPGYRGSRPVRTRNRASAQLQLSPYGDLLTTTWLYVRDGNELDPATARRLVDVVDLLRSLWRNEDAGFWELLTARHFTQSKMGAWVAFDRALRLVDDGQLPSDHAAAWRAEGEAIRDWVESHCWSEEKRSYVQYAGADTLDATCLLIGRMEYADPRDERNLLTIDAIRRELAAGPLLFRYSGAEAEEGAFVACSFWLVEALARAECFEEAQELMEELLTLANDVGLYSEEIDPRTHEFLGNFPQGLSHLALMNAAALYQQSLERARGPTRRPDR